MTIEEAERVGYILKSIKDYQFLSDKLIKLHKEGKDHEVIKIACEMASELARLYEDKLSAI